MAAVSTMSGWASHSSSVLRRTRANSATTPSVYAHGTAAQPTTSTSRSAFPSRRTTSRSQVQAPAPEITPASSSVASATAANTAPTTQASRPSTSANAQPQSQGQPSSTHKSERRREYDPYYGFRHISLLSEHFVNVLFSCPTVSPDGSSPRVGAAQTPAPKLAEFVAYALYRTRLPEVVTYHTLYLLKRLKQHFPAARGSSGHPLFLAAMMLASKCICDDTYSNKSWSIVGQGLFTLSEVNHMERELFGFLDYKVTVEAEELEAFIRAINDPATNLEHYLYLSCVAPRSSSRSPQSELSDVSHECPPLVPEISTRPSWRLSAPDSSAVLSPYAQAHASANNHTSPKSTHPALEPIRTYSVPGYGSSFPGPTASMAETRTARAMTVGAPPAVSSNVRISRAPSQPPLVSPAQAAYLSSYGYTGYTPGSSAGTSYSLYPPSASHTGSIGDVPRLSYSSSVRSSASAQTTAMDILSPGVMTPAQGQTLAARALVPHTTTMHTLTKSPQQEAVMDGHRWTSAA